MPNYLGRQGVSKLLRTVKGKPHASSDDHEEEFAAATRGLQTVPKDIDTDADPISSGDEETLALSPKVQSLPSVKETARAAGGLIEPGGIFGMAHSAPKRQRVAGTTPNIFAPPQSSYGKSKTYGSQQSRVRQISPKQTVPEIKKAPSRLPKQQQPPLQKTAHYDSEGADSDVSMVSLKIPTPKKTKRRRLAQEKKNMIGLKIPNSPTKERSKNIMDTLAAYNKTKRPNLDPNASGDSTPLSSLTFAESPKRPSEESIQKLEQYFADLPPDESESRCPLCEKPVQHYWDYWKGKKMTVHHQKMFCRDHNFREAQEEYRSNGYPDIDWDTFPETIKRHHPKLIAILRNDVELKKPSYYRDQHAERQAIGERPTINSMLNDDKMLEAKTGYYGARGRRAMMESITAQLVDVIRECNEKDPVVSFLGMANFVLRVLVPELTIELVKQDLKVGDEEAMRIIEESGEVGDVVHPEVEDVVLRTDSEDEVEG